VKHKSTDERTTSQGLIMSEQMNRKVFSQRFNRELSLMDLPTELNEKTKAVAKVFGVTRHLANSMLFGHILPDDIVLTKIAKILEVCPLWLSGATSKRKEYSES
jgi:ribosome-binding protein aMBF1 (putative translation factor)